MDKWFTAQAGDGKGIAKVMINGDIGDHWWDYGDVTSDRFLTALNALGEVSEIHIDMNSPGGSVSGGLTIANYLRNHKAKVIVNVLGQASSIASVIAAAADEVHMGIGSFMLIHNPWTAAAGNADEFRAMAKDLDTLSAGMLDAYVARVGEDNREAMAALMKGEDGQGEIVSAEKAVELGLADSSLQVQAAASACMTRLGQALAKAASEAQAMMDAPAEGGPMTAVQALAAAFDLQPEDVEAQAEDLSNQIIALRTAPDSGELSLELLQAKHSDLYNAVRDTVDVDAAVKASGDAERERVATIIKACSTTGTFAHLEKMVTEDWDAPRAADYILAAAAGGEHVISGHSPEGGAAAVSIDSSKIYQNRNRKNRAH